MNRVLEMKRFWKIALTGVVLLLVVVMGVAGGAAYLYHHPEHVKPLAESVISSSLGASCSIDELSLSLSPLSFRAEGIELNGVDKKRGFSAAVPSIRADLDFEGGFGHRSLAIKSLFLDSPSLILRPPLDLPEKEPSGLIGKMAEDLFGFLFFTDVSVVSAEIKHGSLSVFRGGLSIRAGNIEADYERMHTLEINFSANAEDVSRNADISLESVSASAGMKQRENGVRLVSGTIRIRGAAISDPFITVSGIRGSSDFTYLTGQKRIRLEPFELELRDISVTHKIGEEGKEPGKTPGASLVTLKTGVAVSLPGKAVTLSGVECIIRGLDPGSLAEGMISPVDALLYAERIERRDDAGITVEDAGLEIENGALLMTESEVPLAGIRFSSADGRIHPAKYAAAFESLRFHGFGTQNLRLSFSMEGEALAFGIKGEDTRLIDAAQRYRLLPENLEVSAGDRIHVDASGSFSGPWHFEAATSLSDLSFATAEGRAMGEAVTVDADLAGTYAPRESEADFSLKIRAGEGEVLYDRFYLNLSNNRAGVSGKGAYRIKESALELFEAEAGIEKIFSIEGEGMAELDEGGVPAKTEFSLTIPETPLLPIFHHLVKEPFGAGSSLLKALSLSGRVSGECSFSRTGKETASRGRIRWEEGSFSLPDSGLAMKGIRLDLPFWYDSEKEEGSEGAEPMRGALSVAKASIPLLPEQSLTVALRAGPNGLATRDPIEIEVPGGGLRLSKMAAESIFSPSLFLLTSLSLTGPQGEALNLVPLGAELGLTLNEAKAFGTLAPIEYRNHRLTTSGAIVVRLFGGTVVLENLGASGLFSRAPVYRLDARWGDLLLSEITTETAFGRIEGVLKGHLENLEVAANGQPQKFDLLLETVDKRGVDQTISVKAIENISQIGGGRSPFVGGIAGIFASVFETFPYQKIGVKASLENDVFTLNGTMEENGTEYIVKRGAFSGVNVINQNPNNQIHFKDMVKRIQRIARENGAVVE